MKLPMKPPKRDEVLKDILGAFERRVELEWVEPQRIRGRDKGYVDNSPPGYYHAVIVPFYLDGRVVTIMPEESFLEMFKVFKRSKKARELLKSTVVVQVDLTRPKPKENVGG